MFLIITIICFTYLLQQLINKLSNISQVHYFFFKHKLDISKTFYKVRKKKSFERISIVKLKKRERSIVYNFFNRL